MGRGMGTVLGTVAGAGVGFALGGPLGAAAGASVGGGFGAGLDGAEAQENIAKAQLAQQQADRQLALQYATPSPEELAQLNKAIALNEADISRKEKLIASSDPALIEAGKQALQLLQGAEAKTLAPLRSSIAKQEQTLRQKLQAQLGTGYENTTAGIQALNAFKEQANNSMSTAQNQSLAQLLGVAQDTSSRYGAQSNIANAGTIGSLFGNIKNRQIGAITGTQITNAGANFVGDLQSARSTQQLFGNVLGAGAMLYGAGAFNGGGGQIAGTTGGPFSTGQTLNPSANIA